MELKGIGASEGAVSGTVVVFTHEVDSESTVEEAFTYKKAIELFLKGRKILYDELLSMAKETEKKYGSDKAGLFEAYAEILMDDEIETLFCAYVKEGCAPAVAAQKAFEEQARELESLEGSYMKERGADLLDIGRRLASAIKGKRHNLPVLTGPCILVADDLGPFETLSLDQKNILGIAVDKGGYTGHLAIVARSLGIPCIVGLGDASVQLKTGTLCAMDGGSGCLIAEPDAETLKAFSLKEEARQLELSKLIKSAAEPARTKDGASILVCANIGSPNEARHAAAQGADGIGIFRTELMFMDSLSLPTEEEQYLVYRDIVETFCARTVTIRTIDIGGDKEHPALGLEKEDNPFLGYRAIRLCLEQPDVFKPQIRAILRAAAFGSVEIMFPLITSLEEIRKARLIVDECRRELASEGIEAGDPAVGIMVETPAAALMACEFAEETDFFSIGTNDLAQYTLAADRGNSRLSGLYDQLDPAVLRLMAMTCKAASDAGIQVGICGELAANPKALPLLIGLGMTKFGVSASRIPGLKAEIRCLETDRCHELAKKAQTLPDAAAVHEMIGNKEH